MSESWERSCMVGTRAMQWAQELYIWHKSHAMGTRVMQWAQELHIGHKSSEVSKINLFRLFGEIAEIMIIGSLISWQMGWPDICWCKISITNLIASFPWINLLIAEHFKPNLQNWIDIFPQIIALIIQFHSRRSMMAHPPWAPWEWCLIP